MAYGNKSTFSATKLHLQEAGFTLYRWDHWKGPDDTIIKCTDDFRVGEFLRCFEGILIGYQWYAASNHKWGDEMKTGADMSVMKTHYKQLIAHGNATRSGALMGIATATTMAWADRGLSDNNI